MATSKTTYVAPDMWLPLAQEKMIPFSDMFALGGVQVDSTNVGLTGEYMHNAYQESLDNAGELTQITTDITEVTPEAMLDYEIITPFLMFGKAWTKAQYTQLVRGEDPINQLSDSLASYFAKKNQALLVNTIKAQFGTSGALTDLDSDGNYQHIHAPGTDFTFDALVDAQAKFGENMSDLNICYIHSKQLATFKKTHATTDYPASDLTNNVLSTGQISEFNGVKFIINNTLCAVNSDGTYPSFLISGQPFYWGWINNLYEDSQHYANKGGGTDEYYYYYKAAFGIKGISYTSATFPATAATTMIAPTSFTLKWESLNVPIVKINTSLTA